jgi:hypothetical protein
MSSADPTFRFILCINSWFVDPESAFDISVIVLDLDCTFGSDYVERNRKEACVCFEVG